MATTVTGTVRLPDGASPLHARIVLTADAPVIGAVIIPRGPVVVAIGIDSSWSVALEAEARGTPYSGVLEYWSTAENRLIQDSLGRIVPTGAPGPFAWDDLAALALPQKATRSVQIKRGDTLSWMMRWLDDHGRPLSLAGVTVSASLRGPDDVLRPLTVTKTTPDGSDFEVLYPHMLTEALPLGGHQVDVKFATATRVLRTVTGSIEIIREVTP